jgi:phosphoribosylglycinamide formyltransferase-1
LNASKTLSLVVLISGSGSNLQAIIDAIEKDSLNATIQAVISNRPAAFGLERAQRHGISTIALDHTEFDSREAFDARLMQEIERFQPDVIVLAGYMRILTERFILHFSPNLLNIHPSLLPKYQGLHTHQRVLENNDEQHGVSIHVVTPELDAGPVILQGEFTVDSIDDVDSLQQKAHKLEHQMYPLVISWLSEKRLTFNQGLPVFDNETLQHPISFNKL